MITAEAAGRHRSAKGNGEGAFVVVGSEHAPAAHGVAGDRIPGGIEARSQPGVALEDEDVSSTNGAVADEEGRASQRSDPAASEVGLASARHLIRPIHSRRMRASHRSD